MNGPPEIFSRSQETENSRQYLLLRMDTCTENCLWVPLILFSLELYNTLTVVQLRVA